MERRADSAVCERGVGDVEVDAAAESEDSKKGFDGGFEDGLSSSGYNEVFEEALEPPSPLLQNEVPDSRYAASNGAEVGAVTKQEESLCPTDLTVSDTNDGVAVEEQMVDSEKFADRTDAVVHHQRLDEQEKVDTERSDNSINATLPDQSPDEEMIGLEKLNGAVDAEIDGRRDEVEAAVSDVYVDAQHVDQNSEEEILVESQKRIAASGKSDSALGEKEDEDNPMHTEPYSVVLDNEYGDAMNEDANESPVVANDRELPVFRKFDSSIDEQNNDVIFEEHKAFESEEVIAANDEPDHAHGQVEGEFDSKQNKPSSLVSQCVNGDEISETELRSSVVVEDGELIVVNVKESFAKRPNEELEGVKLDELSNFLHGDPTNTNEVSSDIGLSRQIPDLDLIQQVEDIGDPTNTNEVSSDIGLSRQIPDLDLIQQVEDISIQSVAILKQQEKFHQPEENATTDNSYATIGHSPVGKNDSGIATNGHASVEKDGSSSSCAAITANVRLKEDKADTRDSTKESQKESVESHLSSTSSDKKNVTQLASVSLNPEHSRGPNLSSRPAGLGSSAPLLENLSRPPQQPRANGSTSQRVSLPSNDPPIDDGEENDETREKLQMIRVKFLRLAHRLGQTPHNVVVAQVLYRLGLAEQLKRNTNRTGVFSFDRAKVVAEQLEAAGQETLDFSCTIMVIGKTGVGKSATINSIFDEVKLPTNAFQFGTKKVQEVVGMVQGIKVRVIDTPGLFSSSSDQHRNEKILHSVKKFIAKSPPDIVLYFDRLDMQSRDYGDAPLLRTITDIFGASIWFNAIVVLTHAASAPPDGPNGSPLSYEMFVTQRTHVVQQAIRQAAGDVRLMNPVSLVENHSACRMNRAGQRVLPNGQVWKPQLLLLSFASKILGEANMLLNLQDSPPGRPFGSRPRVPPLPFLLSSLLQSKPQPKLPEDQFGDDDNLDEDLDETSDSDEGSDIDELPPFKPLTKSQIAKLSKAQKKAYFEELDYRERLFYKKQLKEEKRRRKFAKKMAHMAKDAPSEHNNGDVEEESGAPASVPVPLPDFVLPNSFDSDNPTHRYRFLDSSSQWLIRPVLDSQGWDHDIGYEGLNVERTFVVKDKIPLSVSGQLTKDKKECTFQMELANSIKHSESKATSLCLDMQTVGKDIAYTLRGETRFRNFRRNNTVAGVSATVLGDSTSAGLKLEDKLIVSKRLRLLVSGGAMTGRGDVAYGGRLEATLRDKDYPIGQALSTLALSMVDWHGDLSLGCNIQSHMPLGRGTNLIGHANLSNKGTGQIGVRLNSSEHLQIVLVALVPILRNAQRMLFSSQST